MENVLVRAQICALEEIDMSNGLDLRHIGTLKQRMKREEILVMVT